MILLKHLVALGFLITCSVLCNDEKKPRPQTPWECNEWCHTELGCIHDEAPWGLQWVANGELGKKCQCQFDPAFLEYLESRGINHHSHIIRKLRKKGTHEVKSLLEKWEIPLTHDCESAAQSLIEEEHEHHIPDGDGLSCSENCSKDFGCINGSQGTRIPIAIGAIKEVKGSEKCECRISSQLKALLESKGLSRSQLKKTLDEVDTQIGAEEILKVIELVKIHTQQEVQFPITGSVSSGKEIKREHGLSEEKCKDKCRKEAGYRLVETKDKVVRAWITEGYIRPSRILPRTKKCECKSSEVLMNYMFLKRIDKQKFESLRKNKQWEEMKKWLNQHDLSLSVHGQERGDDEDGTSCTQKCGNSHGYIEGDTRGSHIFLMIGEINDNKFIKVQGRLQRDVADCECRINPILKELLKSKHLNVSEFEKANKNFEAEKWLLDHIHKRVHFLEPKKSLEGPRDLLTVKGCEEHCLENEGYIGFGPFNANRLKVANGKVVEDSRTGPKCNCEINGVFIDYLKKKGLDSKEFEAQRKLGNGKEWLKYHKIVITYKQASSPVTQRHQHPPSPAKREPHPLPLSSEQKNQHLPKEKNKYSRPPTDHAHHRQLPPPEQKNSVQMPAKQRTPN
ncbi:uncharacterized protein [Bemisia tabaci]|uniref:uncharacterized protein isoform X1 n=1 Tax=Bemisia tabaci TaxID=7038 RepID=UPI003B27DE05